VKLTLIPSSVAGSGPEHHQYLSSCLINDTLALDAGCIGFYQAPHDQARVRHVLLSHTHMDHLASLPIFVENAYEGKTDCVTVHASATVLDCCQRDLFNDRIWPDFLALSRGERPFLKMSPFEAGQTIELDGLHVTAVELNHVVPTVGYVVRDGQGSIAFVSDTGPTDEVWRQVNQLPDLKAVFLEVTFPNEMAWLADLSKHLTPATFAAEVAKLRRPVRVIVVHVKARYQTQVLAELRALNLPNVEIGQFGTPYVI
jgi:ribonuclease BN (tRNA processing enzyme)